VVTCGYNFKKDDFRCFQKTFIYRIQMFKARKTAAATEGKSGLKTTNPTDKR
jgi:hypothetical protein